MSPEEIELYKDAIKIGLPALFGFLAGLVPFVIEKSKSAALEKIESEKNKRELVLQFSDALSTYFGNSSAYIIFLMSKQNNGGEEWDKRFQRASDRHLESEIDRVKTKTLAGVIGNDEVINALLDYDNAYGRVIVLYESYLIAEEDARKLAFKRMHESERKLLKALSKLL
ncbi:hypothetical protein ACWOUW_004267 [Vibrio vulnificus]